MNFVKASTFVLTGFFISYFSTHAQTDSAYSAAYLIKSTRFAATTLGVDLFALGGGTTSYTVNTIPKSSAFSTAVIPRVSIGGIHFWGHADFYVSFPLSFLALRNKPADLEQFKYNQGIETGFKIYPLALKPGRISPFVGTSFKLLNFQQEVKGSGFKYGGAKYQKMIYPLQLGVTYTGSDYLISLGVQAQKFREFTYYTSTNTSRTIELKPLSFQIGFTKYWDTDKNMRTPSSVANENNKYRVLEKEKKLSSWYWAIGPSAGIQTRKSTYLRRFFPHLYDDYFGSFMPDISFGRFFNKPDMNIGLSYRTMGDRLEGYNDRIKLRRHSFMIEAYKNLFNYLGFVPFCGVTGSIENLSMDVNGTKYSDSKPALGLIFGWDIRVTKTGTSLLRTNLRYIPGLHLNIENTKMQFNQLEFNFIQWVQFIGRKKIYKKYS